MLHGHGDDAYRYGREVRADFSTNVWYGGEPEGLKDHLFENWGAITSYPEVLAESLCEKVSTQHGLPPSCFLVTNGTTESIYLVAQAFRNEKTTIAVPAFAEYEDACRLHGHQLQFLDWPAISPGLRLEKGLFFICNPNNPDGNVLEQLEELVAAHPGTVFVIDEAFIEFTLSLSSFIGNIVQYPNVIVLRSLTKAFAIPGLRLGYMAAHPVLIEKIKAFKSPWSVNSLAIAAGHFIFDNYPRLQLPLQQLLDDREVFTRDMEAAGIPTTKSHTHFFVARTPKKTARELKHYLLHRHGLLVRDASNFRGLDKEHFRVATLTPAKNQLLTKALNEWTNR